MPTSRRALISGAAALAACAPHRPPPALKGNLDRRKLEDGAQPLVRRAMPGAFGAGVLVVKSEEPWFVAGDRPFPLAGLMVLPLAIAALAQVDQGRLTLNAAVRFGADDLSAPPGAIDARWPTPPQGHAAQLPVADLIALAVQRGDATAADVLMRRIGGPGAVQAFLDGKTIAGVRVDRYLREVSQDEVGMAPFRPEWKDEGQWLAARDSIPPEMREKATEAFLADPRDTASPRGLALLLDRLALGELLSARSTQWLIQLIRTRLNPFAGLAAGLPRGAQAAHVAARAPTDLGRTPAALDAGVVTLGATRLVLVACLSGSTASAAERQRLFAAFARLALSALS